MTPKENICLGLADQECYALSVYSLLNAAARDHFDLTVSGWLEIYLDRYSKISIKTEEQAALRWMTDHYDSISAVVRAARDLSEVISVRASDLWLDAVKLSPGDSIEPA